MRNLRERDLLPVLSHKVLEEKTPVLGICLGMQLMTRWSEEGDVEGLGWLDAVTQRFRFDREATTALPVPHVGWNTLRPTRRSPLLQDIPAGQSFYFVHSYHVRCEDPADVLTTTHYGGDFVSSIWRGNIVGTQFHPEKSHRRGMQFVQNFITCVRESSLSSS